MFEEIPFRSFAELLDRRPEKRMTLLRKLAFPARRYAPPYARARPLINKYVAGVVTRESVLRIAAEWRRRARGGGKGAANYLNNAGMVERFVSNFDMTGVERAFPSMFVITFGEIPVRVAPDFCVVRNGREEFTKLIFAKAAQPPNQLRINSLMARLMFDGVRGGYPEVTSQQVQLFNVAFGRPLWGEPLDEQLRRRCVELAGQIVVAVGRLRHGAPQGRTDRV